mmetsp:Transcript_1220/g.3410  ORF Transcript_1220/g.3410 Transcript_1220/m.3410 type:complete len:120 (+) Transcript_1220:140-499(+)
MIEPLRATRNGIEDSRPWLLQHAYKFVELAMVMKAEVPKSMLVPLTFDKEWAVRLHPCFVCICTQRYTPVSSIKGTHTTRRASQRIARSWDQELFMRTNITVEATHKLIYQPMRESPHI